MALTIDQLNIQIAADSKQATTAIDNLAASLGRLKSALGLLSGPNNKILAQYKELAALQKNVYFGGRLAQYTYADMDDTIAAALKLSKQIFRI